MQTTKIVITLSFDEKHALKELAGEEGLRMTAQAYIKHALLNTLGERVKDIKWRHYLKPWNYEDMPR